MEMKLTTTTTSCMTAKIKSCAYYFEGNDSFLNSILFNLNRYFIFNTKS